MLRHEFECSEEEIEEIIAFTAEQRDRNPYSAILIDLMECQLSTRLKKPWGFKRFLRFGCVLPLLRFSISEEELINGIRNGELLLNVMIDVPERISGQCPLDGERCERSIKEVSECKKFRKLLNLQKEGVWWDSGVIGHLK